MTTLAVEYPLFAAVPFFACVICTALALAMFSRDPGDRAIRANAIFMLAPGFWAFFESLALIAPNAAAAHRFYLLSTPGHALVPPLILYGIGCIVDEAPGGRFRRMTWLAFAVSLGFTVSNFTNHTLVAGVEPTPWGWGVVPGPALPAYVAFTMAVGCLGVWRWLSALTDRPRLGDERRSWSLATGFIVPMTVGVTTDAILPLCGIQSPRLGVAAFGFLAVMVLVTTVRRGFMFATPGIFARQILETLPSGVALVAPDGTIRFANSGLERITGIDSIRLVGTPIASILPAPEIAVGSDLRELESEVIRHAGATTPVSLSTSTIADRRGNELGTALLLRDIREITSLRSRLITSGRLAAVGQLAAGIAHEINNPLAFVRSNLGLLREHWAALDKGIRTRVEPETLQELIAEGEEVIDESLEGVDRAVRIVRDVRDFSHAGRNEREHADMNALLDRVLRVAAPEIGPDIRVEKDYDSLPLILCSPQQIEQVLLNLVINAIHAVDGAGRISLRTRASGSEIRLWVDDDGRGITSDALEHIFDPFFTTKDVGQGTGLGLSISYEIVRGHGGELSFEPKAGPGARFALHLPIGAAE